MSQVVDNRGQVDIAVLDLAEAFSHRLLVHKLKQFRINGKLIMDYLSNRLQQIVIGNSVSELEQVHSAVP